MHAAPNQFGQSVLLRPVADPWPFADASAAVPALVQAIDLIEVAVEGRAVDQAAALAAWDLIDQHATVGVPSWYRATRPPRAGPDSRIALVAPKGVMRALKTAPATDVGTLAAILFAVGQPVRRADLLEASGWTPLRAGTLRRPETVGIVAVGALGVRWPIVQPYVEELRVGGL